MRVDITWMRHLDEVRVDIMGITNKLDGLI